MTKEKRYEVFEKDFIEYFNQHKKEIVAALVEDKEQLSALAFSIYQLLFNISNNSSIETFTQILTSTEIEALQYIFKDINNSQRGNISISNLIKESGISRPVFKSLLQKMEKNEVAFIESQGVKGTYIEILNMDIYKLKK